MGTAFYHRTNICACCDRYDEQHICNSHISFEALMEWPDEMSTERVVVVGSWQEWKARLVAIPGEVWDEYGKQIPVEQFIADVESAPMDRRRWQYDWVVRNPSSFTRASEAPEPDATWLDADGFTFCGRGFE